MGDSDMEKTVVIDSDDCDLISEKLTAVNNKIRFYILEILRDNQKRNQTQPIEPLYSRDINNVLSNNYNVSITPQMLGQHIKKLQQAGLVREVLIKKEVPNKIGKRTVKGYELKKDAFEDLFLEISFLCDELFTFFDLFESNLKVQNEDTCVLTVFNGIDKGKTFKVKKDETALIGRNGEVKNDSSVIPIPLDNSYETVSSISKPHLKLFNEDGHWHVLDECSSNGTYVADRQVKKGSACRLDENTFIKLSKGSGGAVIYISFN